MGCAGTHELAGAVQLYTRTHEMTAIGTRAQSFNL